MNPSVHIRLAAYEDADLLSTLASGTFTATFGHLYKPDDLSAHLATTCSKTFFIRSMQENSAILIAFYGDEPVGYVKGGKLGLPVKPVGLSSEIHRLYVINSFQKKGVGTLLMESILKTPVISGSDTVYLGVWENNTKAQKFHARYHFTPVGEYVYYVGHNADREIIMARNQRI